MGWNIHVIQRKTKSYVALKKNERVGKKVKSSYIYLGPTKDAMKIFADLQIKPLIDEKEISYSGEIIRGKIADSINFSEVMKKYTGDKRVAEILTNIVILRTIFSDSKRNLVKARLSRSILKNSSNLKYLEEGWLCDDCAGNHECGDEMLLPVVNSPRVGVCGYVG